MFYYPVLACPRSQRADTPRSGSGNGPERALKAITLIPRAQRESPILPRASSASAGPVPRSAQNAKRSGIGPQRALEANTNTPRAQRESPNLPRASSASAGPFPRSAKTRPAERDRSEASLGGEHQYPSRTARKPHPPPSFLSERRTVPAERPIRPAERDRSAASLGSDHQAFTAPGVSTFLRLNARGPPTGDRTGVKSVLPSRQGRIRDHYPPPTL